MNIFKIALTALVITLLGNAWSEEVRTGELYDQAVMHPTLPGPRKATLVYIKGGGGTLTGPEHSTPAVMGGIGIRYRKGQHGVDASYALSSILLEDATSKKLTYLYYPWAYGKTAFYLGFGGAYNHYRDPLGLTDPSWSITSISSRFLALDFMAGIELRRTSTIKLLLQLEVTKPVNYLKGNAKFPGPSWLVSTGLGF